MKPWEESWCHRGGRHEDIDFDTAQERGKFMIEASKILVRLDPQLLQVQGLRKGMVTWPEGSSPKDLDTQEELRFEDHVETLALGWHTRFSS